MNASEKGDCHGGRMFMYSYCQNTYWPTHLHTRRPCAQCVPSRELARGHTLARLINPTAFCGCRRQNHSLKSALRVRLRQCVQCAPVCNLTLAVGFHSLICSIRGMDLFSQIMFAEFFSYVTVKYVVQHYAFFTHHYLSNLIVFHYTLSKNISPRE